MKNESDFEAVLDVYKRHDVDSFSDLPGNYFWEEFFNACPKAKVDLVVACGENIFTILGHSHRTWQRVRVVQQLQKLFDELARWGHTSGKYLFRNIEQCPHHVRSDFMWPVVAIVLSPIHPMIPLHSIYIYLDELVLQLVKPVNARHWLPWYGALASDVFHAWKSLFQLSKRNFHGAQFQRGPDEKKIPHAQCIRPGLNGGKLVSYGMDQITQVHYLILCFISTPLPPLKSQSRVPTNQLLVFNVKEGWAPLCAFLDRPIPDAPFPRVNVDSGRDGYMDNFWNSSIFMAKCKREAVKSISIYLALLIMVWYYLPVLMPILTWF